MQHLEAENAPTSALKIALFTGKSSGLQQQTQEPVKIVSRQLWTTLMILISAAIADVLLLGLETSFPHSRQPRPRPWHLIKTHHAPSMVERSQSHASPTFRCTCTISCIAVIAVDASRRLEPQIANCVRSASSLESPA